MSLTIGSLCSGAGGLDLAVADVLGDARTAAALRLCGNGVVRQQGAAAYRLLGVAHA